MSDLSELYQEMILDHYKNPRNFRVIDDYTHDAEGHNPLCGDQLHIYLKLNDKNTIEDVSFEGNGCAISKASASMMTAHLKGKTPHQARALFDHIHQMLTGKNDGADPGTLGKLAALSGVSEFPVRVKCATLAWHTLLSALDNKKQEEPVSTE